MSDTLKPCDRKRRDVLMVILALTIIWFGSETLLKIVLTWMVTELYMADRSISLLLDTASKVVLYMNKRAEVSK
jgi:hypothetical protein